MKLLLINPRFPESFWSFKWAIDTATPGVRTINPPLGLATLAALCPDDWVVEIVDENAKALPLEPDADIIGICGMGVQFERQRELLGYYRNKGHYVVAGGSYASLCPERYDSLADTVVAGEAEYIWLAFCKDFESGSPMKLYQETGVVALADSPVPRFDLLEPGNYSAVSMQFSRGCPFLCEFCDIIVMFGRRPRTKPLPQIGAELDKLRALGVTNVFFVDDNLIGNIKKAKELLRFLRDYQKEHDYRFHFGTEASLNLAQDRELLELFREARFEWVFIGIESPDADSLKEARKLQNTRADLITSIREIYRHGIDILAGFIIGFDNDTTDVFDKQYRFIVESGIQSAMIGLLVAAEKTPLHERLEKEGRLIPGRTGADNSKLATNVIPKGMSYDEMITGYRKLHHRLLQYPAIAERIRNKIRYLTEPQYENTFSLRETVGFLGRLFRHVLARQGMAGVFHLLRSVPISKPRMIPMVFHDWVVGLSMRDYVDRHFKRESEKERRLAVGYSIRIRKALRRYRRRGSLRVSLHQGQDATSNLWFCIKGRLDGKFFRRSTHQLEKMLRNTRTSVTLRIEEFDSGELQSLRDMLERLKQYRDRIIIAADERSRRIINIDSSVFNLVMES